MASGPPRSPSTAIAVPTSLVRYQISPAAFLDRHLGVVDHLVAAAVVAHGGRILVLQRSRHDYAGLTWEVPGGSCETADETILGAACRELWEESGLRAIAVVDVVEDAHDWIDNGKTWRKMTFLVEVGGDELGASVSSEPAVKLDPGEHEDFVWVSEQEALEGKCGEKALTWISPEQRIVILDAFKLLRSRVSNHKEQ